MPRLPDDPRLTAFALGELPPEEARALEAALAEDPEALAVIAEVRATAALLADQLRGEAAPGLAPTHLDAIEACLRTRPGPDRARWARPAIAAGLLGLAATLLLPGVRRALRPAPEAHDLAVLAPATTPPIADRKSSAGSTPVVAEPDPRAAPAYPPMQAPVTGLDLAAPPTSPPARLGLPDGSDFGVPPELALRIEGLPAPPVSGIAPPGAAKRALVLNRPLLGRSRSEVPSQPVRPAHEPGTRSQQLARRGDPSQTEGSSATSPLAAGPELQQALVVPASPGDREQSQTRREALLKEKEALASNSAFRMKETLPASSDRVQEAARRAPVAAEAQAGGEAFGRIEENDFRPVLAEDPSTFSIDCDTASYSSVRKFLNRGVRPPREAVRIEELINYFPYDYTEPRGEEPFSIDVEVAGCPWASDHRLVRVGLKGREVAANRRPPSNLVFLIDVSGSMEDLDKLPLLKAGMKLLVESLGENDRVAIVVYAQSEGLALDSTSCARKGEILSALDQLRARGRTDGGRGITLAYDVAVRNFIPGGTNRVLLATDGDFNIGVTEGADLDRLIEAKRETGVFLSVLGFGEGNVRHDRLERLAARGNGQYCFVDSINEARKVLVDQMGGTLVTIARDVKIQVVFNPDRAASYRQIGYENRQLPAQDFADDRKDAGEIGAGHTVTALYEVIPPGQGGPPLAGAARTDVRSARTAEPSRSKSKAPELLRVDIRCKPPEGDTSRQITRPGADDGREFAAASPDFRFASAVAGFGMLLRESPHKGDLTWPGLVELTAGTIGRDVAGYRKEFLELVRKAQVSAPR